MQHTTAPCRKEALAGGGSTGAPAYSKPGEYEFRNGMYLQPLTGNEESLEMVEIKIH